MCRFGCTNLGVACGLKSMNNEHNTSPTPSSDLGQVSFKQINNRQDSQMVTNPVLDHAFLREVHHKVKNNLQVVCSLLRLQSRGVADMATRDVFKRSEERIQSMALVYDKLYRDDGYDTVPLDEYLRDMIDQLVSSSRPRTERPQLVFTLDHVTVSSRTATAVGLLMNEVVSHHLRSYASNALALLRVALSYNQEQITIDLGEDMLVTSERIPLGDMEQQILAALLKQVDGAITYEVEGKIHTRIVFPSC